MASKLTIYRFPPSHNALRAEFALREKGFDFANKAPALGRFLDRCKARPSVRESGWLEIFDAFVAERKPNRVLE